ncbi:MAG: hypothetical protein WDO73_07870 [Ignavibacteriota bacterium]
MNLEVVGAADRLGLRGANRGADAAAGSERKSGLGIADAAHEFHGEFLAIDRRVNAVDINKVLAILQRAVVPA